MSTIWPPRIWSRRGAFHILAALAIVIPLTEGYAQTVDYGALEKLFAEPVTTSATGSPQRVSEVPADMEIVTADDIRRSGAVDIPGVLAHVAGVDVLQWTSGDADISIQGYNQPYSSRLLVLIDGRQVYADYYGLTPWSALPIELSAIRQIEIVKGPASALFGFNAVGGVINIITSSPLYDRVNAVSLTVGTRGFAQGSVVSTYKFNDRVGFRIEAGGRSNDEFPIPPNIGFDRRSDDRGSIDVEGLFQLADEVQFGLEASHTRADQIEMIPTFYELANVNYTTNSIKGQLSAETGIGLVQGTAYTNWISTNMRASYTPGAGGVLIPQIDLKFDNSVTVVQLQDLINLGSSHTIRGSLEYRHNESDTTPMAGGQVYYDVVSAGAMWDWKIDPNLSLTNALRLDDLMLGRSGSLPRGAPFTDAAWSRTEVEPSFNSGLVWQPDEADTFRLTASRGVQVPSLTDFGAVQDVIPGRIPQLITGVPALEPTVVTNFEVGWDRAVPEFKGQIRVSLFSQHTNDEVSNPARETLLPAFVLVAPANIGDSNAEGLEFELKGQIGQAWRWGISYTPEIITDHFSGNALAAQFPVDFQHTTPTHVVKANLGWSAGAWEVDGFARYESRFYGLVPTGSRTPLTPIDNYVALDGRVAYRLADWATLALSGQNLGQSGQHQTVGPPVQRRIVGSLAVEF
jgi:iron complex outermembrane receptor protein